MTAERVHYLDWLRWLAVLVVVAYHALLPFGSLLPWIISNAEQNSALALASALMPFAFPLFFLLAGASARYSLRSRSLRSFLTERTARLGVPFIVGTVVLSPLTAYVIAVHNSAGPVSFIDFLVAYPQNLVDHDLSGVGFSPHALQVIGMHLWFLAWLFLDCVIAAPALAYLANPAGRGLTDRLARAARLPGATLLFAIPVILVALPLFGVSSRAGWDWAVFGMWGVTFLGGYVMFGDERLVAAARRDLVPAVVAAAVAIGGLAATGFTDSIFRGGAHTYDATYVVIVSLHGLAVWSVTLAVLGLAMRVGSKQRPLGRRAAEWTLPTYVLHYPIVIAVSSVVVGLPLDLWPKAALNVGLGLGVTLVVVAVVTRNRLVRPLLGLRGAAASGPTGPSGFATGGLEGRLRTG